MKLPPLKFLALAALVPVMAAAQTMTPATPAQQQPQQALAITQQANQLLANPALLFSQLDVDNDGLLNLNEFAPIAALSTQPVVVPNANGTLTPNNGVAPINGPNGAYTPDTGVPAATNNNGVITPNTGVPPPNMRGGSALPSTGPSIPTRPNP
ncbi:hypothetical protein WJU23_19120 [Prosthecobacter sp. SYSU 5D2]|uniref:hypothetical protein n=1 Tax=Prosthecobacter sp. SYSU 5D2 TaxID=3134134 RepID=UPI0031FF132D